jgi:predicted RNA-binding protein with PUA-like domain
MAFWLLKTEPGEYSWTDLEREQATVWDGVRAAPALKNMRAMQPGDRAFIYHTGQERAIVGIAEITSSPYHDPDTDGLVFKIAPRQRLRRAVTLSQVKANGRFADWDLVRLPRLSVVPVSGDQWEWVLGMAKE